MSTKFKSAKNVNSSKPISNKVTHYDLRQAILNELMKAVGETPYMPGAERTLALRNASDALLTLTQII
jgi:hypothetical protein